MNESKFILDNFFNNNEKFSALRPLEPRELIFLATDWMNEFSDLQIINIFKIVNPSSGNYQYFTLDSDLDIMEYIPDKHYFFLNVNTEIKNKLISLFIDNNNNNNDKLKKEIYNDLITKLKKEIE